ncbi:MAG TPA: sialidase family protein [Acidimicrobiales bacterium]|nr:sialidase family protein [Acidimicrobiales bacterium]
MNPRRVLAAGLAAAGVVASGLALRGPEPAVEATATGMVNDDRPGTLDAHTSPAAAADPGRPDSLVVADRIDTPTSSCAVSSSTDGGATWRRVPLPLPDGAPNCFWPDVAWTGDGALVLFGATGGGNNQPVGTWAQRLEHGAPAGPAVVVSGPDAFHPRIAADGDRVVATWVQADPATAARALGFAPRPNPLMASVSTDGGRSFGPPRRVSEPAMRLLVPSVVVGADTVVVGALDLGDDAVDYSGLHEGRGGPPVEGNWRVRTWTSTDGGATFGPGVVVADVVIPQRIHPDLGAPRPGLARDGHSGRLYAAWESGKGRARDVFVAASGDGGRSWSPPRPVAARTGTQTLPSVDVAPDGRVDIVFYDRSADPGDVRTEVAQASSWDGGRTFTVATVSPRRFDSRIGLGSFQDLPVVGTQTEVVSGRSRSVAFWSDAGRATRDDNRLDLGVALVRVHRAGVDRLILLAGGALVLAAAGLALSDRGRGRAVVR